MLRPTCINRSSDVASVHPFLGLSIVLVLLAHRGGPRARRALPCKRDLPQASRGACWARGGELPVWLVVADHVPRRMAAPPSSTAHPSWTDLARTVREAGCRLLQEQRCCRQACVVQAGRRYELFGRLSQSEGGGKRRDGSVSGLDRDLVCSRERLAGSWPGSNMRLLGRAKDARTGGPDGGVGGINRDSALTATLQEPGPDHSEPARPTRGQSQGQAGPDSRQAWRE